MSEPDYDLCIIGGGIHGTGIARDAAGRGLKVILLEKDDLASATSSASSKMLHGGLRYLEHFEFRLVREGLRERKILLNLAPHIIRPMDFILPHAGDLRPAWLIRLGLFLYDLLAGRAKLKSSKQIKFKDNPYGAPLKKTIRNGFIYTDGWMDDARLVVLNARDAAHYGADIHTRTKFLSAKVENHTWSITAEHNKNIRTFTAAKIINAAGPWVHDVINNANAKTSETPHIRLVKGSHIVVPRLYQGDHGYIFQSKDRRVIFAWPYGPDYNYIGTTDVDFDGNIDSVSIADEEVIYLCNAVNQYFDKKTSPSDLVSSWSGVRTLLADENDNASAVTRDYKLIYSEDNGAPFLSVFGGKLTTYRTLSEKAVNLLYGDSKWTAGKALPGGDFKDINSLIKKMKTKFPECENELIKRYAHTYGTCMAEILQGTLGNNLGDNVYEGEIDYLIKNEWAQTVEDIIWRRTKLGLQITPQTIENIRTYLEKNR